MGWDGTPWHSTTPTHCDVEIMELQAIECPAAGGHKGGDGQGKGQAPRRLAPDNLGLQEQMSGRAQAGEPQLHRAPHTRSASGERYMLMVKVLQKSPRCVRRVLVSTRTVK